MSGYSYETSELEVAAGDARAINVLCPVDKKPVGWGVGLTGGTLLESGLFVSNGLYGWQIVVRNNDSVTRRFYVAAVCVIALDEAA